MQFALHRLDVTYSAVIGTPMLPLVGGVPDVIRTVYRAFTDRYPTILANAFSALPGTTLADVGIRITLLGGRFEIDLKFSELAGRATNLQTVEEVRFIQDCALLLHNVVRNLHSAVSFGETSYRIPAWIILEGGQTSTAKLLAKIGTPPHILKKDRINATSVTYMPRLELINENERWRALVTVEKSAVQGADLFLMRDYTFAADTKLSSFEQQIAFVDSSTLSVFEWLGLERPNIP